METLPKNVKGAILKNQDAYFEWETDENFEIELSKIYNGLLICVSDDSGTVYLNGRAIYEWAAASDLEYFMGVYENNFNSDEECDEKKLEALRIIIKNMNSSLELFRS